MWLEVLNLEVEKKTTKLHILPNKISIFQCKNFGWVNKIDLNESMVSKESLSLWWVRCFAGLLKTKYFLVFNDSMKQRVRVGVRGKEKKEINLQKWHINIKKVLEEYEGKDIWYLAPIIVHTVNRKAIKQHKHKHVCTCMNEYMA